MHVSSVEGNVTDCSEEVCVGEGGVCGVLQGCQTEWYTTAACILSSPVCDALLALPHLHNENMHR